MISLRKLFPFERCVNERGDSSLIFVGFIAAASFVGATALVKRAVDDGKMAKRSERMANASQNPISAAIVAKSLFAPPGAWETTQLLSNPSLMPSIYVDPYIASQNVINGAAPVKLSLIQPSPTGSVTWDSSQFNGSGKIFVYSADRNRLASSNFEGLLSDAADGGTFNLGTYKGVTTTKTTISNFVISHCTAGAGAPSASFTGHYCVQADFSTESYSTDKSVASGSNKATVFLGTIKAPPKPKCNPINLPTSIQPGDNLNFNISASGVVTGYTMTVVSVVGGARKNLITSDVSRVMTGANGVRSTGSVGPLSINLSNLGLYNYTTLPEGSIVEVSVTLKGITENETCGAQPVRMTVIKPRCSLAFDKPSYVPGERVTMTYSLTNSRTSDVSNLQQSRIALTGTTPASPDVTTTLTGAAPGGPRTDFNASVLLRRGGAVIQQCSSAAVSIAPPPPPPVAAVPTEEPPGPCAPRPGLVAGHHYTGQAGFPTDKFLKVPGRTPFGIYNDIAGNPSNTMLVATDANRLMLCQRSFGPFAVPWGGDAMRFASPGDNRVCDGPNNFNCRNAKAAGNPLHITWTLCRCDKRVP